MKIVETELRNNQLALIGKLRCVRMQVQVVRPTSYRIHYVSKSEWLDKPIWKVPETYADPAKNAITQILGS